MDSHPLDERSAPSRPNVRSASMRKLGPDGRTLTPTERVQRERLMRQFCRTGRKGVEVASGGSPAYRENYDAIDWSKK